MENQAFLKRLQSKKPSVDMKKMENERAYTEKRLRSMCEYPYRLGVTNESKKVLNELIKTGVLSATNSTFKQLKNQPRKLEPIKPTGNLVFKRGVNIGDRYFLIEITANSKNITIVANDIEKPENFALELPLQEAMSMMGGKTDYERLVKMLEMENGELVLAGD